MKIIFAEGMRENLPYPVIRWDLAWALFLPESAGDLPAGDGKQVVPLARWFWETMGQLGGRLRQDSPETIWCVVPPLTKAAQDFAIRLASFWSDEVYMLWAADPSENVWRPPVVDVFSDPAEDGAAARLVETYGPNEEARYTMPLLGVGRAFMRVEVIPPGSATARLHSHSAVDEYYLILAGKGELRMGTHVTEVGPGSLIGKPTGPDLSSHLVASLGESLTVLDMEVWPDSSLKAKDLVHYPDTRELFWRGPGWRGLQVDSSLFPATDIRDHYDDGYTRQPDGSWRPASFPGAIPRPPSDSGRTP